jgi:hypothetical protein
MSDEYDVITFNSEEDVVEELMGKVQELTENDKVKKFSS